MNDFRTAVSLAWRNVWRNPRRTILTLLTIVVGCGVIIFMNAFAKGAHDRMIQDAIELNIGHIQIHEKGFWDNRTVDYAILPDPNLEKFLSKDKRVSAWAPRIHAEALVSFGNNTAGTRVQGIDPDKDIRVSSFASKIKKGRFFTQADSDAAVIGSTLAKNIGAAEGSRITLISQGFDGSIAADSLAVKGIFTSGNPEYDAALILMPLARADETFAMNGYIHSYIIRAASPDDVASLVQKISSSSASTDREIMRWDLLMPELVQYIVLDDLSAYIFDAILFIVVAFGILNTIQLSVFERTREFGIMLAVGTKPSMITWMVLTESFFISLLGVLLGAILGWGISYYYWINPLDVSDYAQELAVYNVSTITYPADASTLNISVTIIITLMLGIVFAFLPARRASRLNPVRAIRQL